MHYQPHPLSFDEQQLMAVHRAMARGDMHTARALASSIRQPTIRAMANEHIAERGGFGAALGGTGDQAMHLFPLLPLWATKAHQRILNSARARGAKWGWILGDGVQGGGSATREGAERAARRAGNAAARKSGGPAPWHSIFELTGDFNAVNGSLSTFTQRASTLGRRTTSFLSERRSCAIPAAVAVAATVAAAPMIAIPAALLTLSCASHKTQAASTWRTPGEDAHSALGAVGDPHGPLLDAATLPMATREFVEAIESGKQSGKYIVRGPLVGAGLGKVTIGSEKERGRSAEFRVVDPSYWATGATWRADKVVQKWRQPNKVGRTVIAHVEYRRAFGWVIFGGSNIRLAESRASRGSARGLSGFGNDGSRRVRDHKIENHGYMISDYFQGCGTSFTSWEDVSVGIGGDAVEAYNDAVDQLAERGWSTDALPKRPPGLSKKMKVPTEYEESYWYICVYVK